MTKDEALEKKAENARELGLDYEPERTWVGLTDEEIDALRLATGYAAGLERFTVIARAIEAKLKENT